MEPISVENWVHLLGDGGLPVVLGWLSWTVAKIFNRWSSHLDRHEAMWNEDTDHRKVVAQHMRDEESYLRRIANRIDSGPKPAAVPGSGH